MYEMFIMFMSLAQLFSDEKVASQIICKPSLCAEGGIFPLNPINAVQHWDFEKALSGGTDGNVRGISLNRHYKRLE